jgi:hypothetical protein
MPSELLKLVKCTGAVHDPDDVAIPDGFVDIGVVDNAPASEKAFVMRKLQTICLMMSGRSQEFATRDS